jgi:hypothetical protein
MTGEFYGEVMARIKNPVDGKVFWRAYVCSSRPCSKSKMAALLIVDGANLCSPGERWIGGMRNHFERVSFQCYLLEDA